MLPMLVAVGRSEIQFNPSKTRNTSAFIYSMLILSTQLSCSSHCGADCGRRMLAAELKLALVGQVWSLMAVARTCPPAGVRAPSFSSHSTFWEVVSSLPSERAPLSVLCLGFRRQSINYVTQPLLQCLETAPWVAQSAQVPMSPTL